VTRGTIILSRLEKFGIFVEDTLLLIILISMIMLAGMQIFLRNFFDYSLYWGDEMLRLMVLWLTVAGGLAASRMDKHISIEVLDRFLPVNVQIPIRILIDLFTAVICALFSWHSARFVMGSYEFGDTLMGNMPAWMLQIILPVGFGLMSYRHIVFAAKRLFKVATSQVSGFNGR
jgi:TRAP-type C4-dicarboxylate transport system permease small subunit